MSRWFRHYAGLMRDEKLVRVAVRSKQPVERVVWVYGAILESAAEINDAGRYEFDAGEAAYFLRCDDDDLVRIVQCLDDIGRLSDGVVVRWSERQFDSDSAKERQRRYRERVKARSDVQERDNDVGKASPSVTGDVTRPSRDGEVTAQETETDTDTRKEEPNGSLSETSSDARKKRKEYPEEFESAWLSYPRDPNMSKAEAFDAWKKLDAADKDALAASIPAFVAYCRANPDYRPIHMCRYIAKRRFDGHGKPTQAPGTDEATWQKRLRFARARQTWSALEWGPRPNSPGCMVPQHLVQPTDGHGWAEFRQEAA